MPNNLLIIFSISKESILDVEGFIRASPQKIESCSQQNVEMHVTKVTSLKNLNS